MNFRLFTSDVRDDKNLTVLTDAFIQYESYPGKAEVAGISVFIGGLEAGCGEKVFSYVGIRDRLPGGLCAR